MSNSDRANPWYHGSPHQLAVLCEGSSITQNRDLARVFSHKPALVRINDDGSIRHSGTVCGYLYCVAEEVRPKDIHPHPRSTMQEGLEWLITRPLRVELIEPTFPQENELLTPEECRVLQAKIASARTPTPDNDYPSTLDQ